MPELPSPEDTAEIFDGVEWGYDPAQETLTPLASTFHWFERFPWEGAELPRRGAGPSSAEDPQPKP